MTHGAASAGADGADGAASARADGAAPARGLRILSVGAFPFPYPQGSQIFAAGQARALAAAGAEVAVAAYGSGQGALASGVRWLPSSRLLAPASGRSGPSLRKPLADAALLATVVRAQRAERFDIALAHNAEAAFVAAAARAITGLRFVYVAHTVMGEELSAYASPRLRRPLDRLGHAIDRRASASANAVLALSEAGRRALAPNARGEIALIPPGHEQREAPSESVVRAACAAAGVSPRSFFLYAGNLDGYQDLEFLDAAAAALGAEFGPVVVATHDATGGERFAKLRVVELRDFAEIHALQFAATALVAPRRRSGGFPIKLLNYMEAARPIVAFEHVADGLVDGATARLVAPAARPEAFARALRELAQAPAIALRLATAAHEHLIRDHDWKARAAQTLALASRASGRSN